ncbi:MAG: cell division protein ZapA [Nitrospirae bacterium]|nr:cell division protein ZapA [Nitrospirota bacterium]
MGSVDVYILGQKYTVKGDAPEDYIQKVAALVDSKIKEVYINSPNITPLKASILAALNIADELCKLRTDQEVVANQIEERTNILSGLFEK